MPRRKLTLSVDGNLLREAKAALAGRESSLSRFFEEFLEYIVADSWLEKLASELKLGGPELLDPASIPRNRPKGLDSASIVRELRGGRLR